MLFMVFEQFKNADPAPLGERFRRQGRMLPDGVVYHASWIDPNQMRCFQLMEALSLQALNEWTRHWNDLVDFEVIPVLTSADFWEKFKNGSL